MKISKRMVLSSIVCVLPLVVSALLYRQLPNQMPIHWNSVGEANGFIGKNIGAWGIPLFMLAIHLVVAIKTENDKSKQHLSVITKGNKTHRFAGAIWVICGFVYIIISFIPLDNGLAGLTILATIIALLAPIIYSYIGEKVDSQNKSA